MDLTKDDKERGASSPIGDETLQPHHQIAKNMGMGSKTYSKCKYVDKHGTEDRNEAKKRQGARNDQWANLNCKDSVNNILQNSGECIKNRENETDRKLAKNIGKLSSEHFRLLKICRHYMQ